MTQALATASAKSKALKRAPDAIALLIEDHQKVKKMFKDFAKLKKADGSDAAKGALAEKICMELSVHAQVEEEIFYPAVRAAIDDDDLMDEADVEHAEAKDLISQLEDMKPGDDHYDAKVKVLGENIDHHVKEEQDEMFPKARKAKVDMAALGAQIAQRKKVLLGG
jgi:hemerythrin superfamily protein